MANLLDAIARERLQVERQFAEQVRLYPRYAVSVAGWLSPALFAHVKIGRFWGEVVERVAPGMPESEAMAVVGQAIRRAGLGDDDFIPSVGMGVEALAPEIARLAWLYSVGEHMPALARAVAAKDDAQVRALLTTLASRPNEDAGSGDIREALADLRELLERRDLALRTGLGKLDRYLGGLPRGELTLLGGRPGMGKTALAMQIAEHVARTGHVVAFFSLEMSRHMLIARRASAMTGIVWRDVLADAISDADRRRFAEAAERFVAAVPLLHIYDGRHTTADIWRKAAAVGAELVVVDHVRLVQDGGKENENLRQGQIDATLKAMAKALRIPVLALVQLSRAVEQRADKRPTMADLRDSGEHEQNADNILLLYREGYYNPDTVMGAREPAEILVEKFRNGPRMRLNVEFERAKFWFYADLDGNS